MSQTSSKPSLSSFGYRMHTLAGAGISIDEIAWRQLPVDLHRKIVELLDFSETVPADTSLVRPLSSVSSLPKFTERCCNRPRNIRGHKLFDLHPTKNPCPDQCWQERKDYREWLSRPSANQKHAGPGLSMRV